MSRNCIKFLLNFYFFCNVSKQFTSFEMEHERIFRCKIGRNSVQFLFITVAGKAAISGIEDGKEACKIVAEI